MRALVINEYTKGGVCFLEFLFGNCKEAKKSIANADLRISRALVVRENMG